MIVSFLSPITDSWPRITLVYIVYAYTHCCLSPTDLWRPPGYCLYCLLPMSLESLPRAYDPSPPRAYHRIAHRLLPLPSSSHQSSVSLILDHLSLLSFYCRLRPCWKATTESWKNYTKNTLILQSHSNVLQPINRALGLGWLLVS